MPLLCCQRRRNSKKAEGFGASMNREEAPVLPWGEREVRFRRMNPRSLITRHLRSGFALRKKRHLSRLAARSYGNIGEKTQRHRSWPLFLLGPYSSSKPQALLTTDALTPVSPVSWPPLLKERGRIACFHKR